MLFGMNLHLTHLSGWKSGVYIKNWRKELAKENTILDTFLGLKPKIKELPLERKYEETIIGSSARPERERNARRAQHKMNWQNKSLQLIERENLCGKKTMALANRNTVCLLF